MWVSFVLPLLNVVQSHLVFESTWMNLQRVIKTKQKITKERK